jgi:hypothetical protein
MGIYFSICQFPASTTPIIPSFSPDTVSLPYPQVLQLRSQLITTEDIQEKNVRQY